MVIHIPGGLNHACLSNLVFKLFMLNS